MGVINEDLNPERASAARGTRESWLKDIDLSRTVENTLVGAILFFGRYPVTFARVLFRPRALESELIFRPSYKNDAQVQFTRPATFLVVSGFVYLAFSMISTGTFMLIEGIVQHFHWLIDRMPKKIEQLTLSKIALFMVPFVLFVSLYAYIAEKVFRMLGARAPFKVHLNIACYVAGLVAVLFVLLSVIEPPAWDLALGQRRTWYTALPLLLLPFLLFGLLALSLYRYLDLTRRATQAGWLRTVIATAVSVATFELASWLLLAAAAPLLEQLK